MKMNEYDEELLIEEMNDFEDFMLNADVEEIAKEHGLTIVDDVVQSEIVESPQDIHNRICNNFEIVEKTLYDICVDLKTIRDNKYYKQLGYDTFKSYCLENFSLKRTQYSSYLSIAKNLSSNFVRSSEHLGVKKLYCLSRLTNEERTELIENTDLEHTPVKEVEKKAKEIKESRKGSKPDESKNTILDAYPSLELFYRSLKKDCASLEQLFNRAFTMDLNIKFDSPSFQIRQAVKCMEKMINTCNSIFDSIES